MVSKKFRNFYELVNSPEDIASKKCNDKIPPSATIAFNPLEVVDIIKEHVSEPS